MLPWVSTGNFRPYSDGSLAVICNDMQGLSKSSTSHSCINGRESEWLNPTSSSHQQHCVCFPRVQPQQWQLHSAPQGIKLHWHVTLAGGVAADGISVSTPWAQQQFSGWSWTENSFISTFAAVDTLIFHYFSTRRGKSRPSEMKRKTNRNQENTYTVKNSPVVRSLTWNLTK